MHCRCWGPVRSHSTRDGLSPGSGWEIYILTKTDKEKYRWAGSTRPPTRVSVGCAAPAPAATPTGTRLSIMVSSQRVRSHHCHLSLQVWGEKPLGWESTPGGGNQPSRRSSGPINPGQLSGKLRRRLLRRKSLTEIFWQQSDDVVDYYLHYLHNIHCAVNPELFPLLDI